MLDFRLSIAVTIGNFIMYPDNMPVQGVLPHEEVHVNQSDWLGPMYLPTVIAGYLVAAVQYPFKSGANVHDDNPMETDADARSGDIRFVSRNPNLK